MLALTLSQLVLLYRQEFPGLAALADASGDGERFRMGLREFVDAHRAAEGEAAEQIRLLIDYDGRSVRELSTDRQLEVRLGYCHRFSSKMYIQFGSNHFGYHIRNRVNRNIGYCYDN